MDERKKVAFKKTCGSATSPISLSEISFDLKYGNNDNKLTRLDLWEIDDICNKHAIGYNQMGEIIPQIYHILNDSNQSLVYKHIGNLSDKGFCVDEIVKKIIDNY